MQKTFCLLLFFICYETTSSETCNRDAFETLVRGKRVPPERFESLGINFLKIPVICEGMFKSCPELDFLRLYNNSIGDIQPGAFNNNPKLRGVHIAANAFRIVKKGVFNGLNLTNVILIDNGIETIERGAFDDMKYLKTLALDQNRLKVYSPDWFGGGANLHEFLLDSNLIEFVPKEAFGKLIGSSDSFTVQLSNNHISSFDDGAFKDLVERKEVRIEINLAYNKISELKDDIFAGINLVRLNLFNNALSCVSDEFLNNLNVTEFEFSKNPLSDECLSKLEKWADANGVSLNTAQTQDWPPANRFQMNMLVGYEQRGSGWVEYIDV